jgi:prepilin peptidase CpaA
MSSTETAALLDLLLQPLADPRTLLLFVLLVAAAWFDARTFRIPNWLTGPGLLLGVVYTTVVPPAYNAHWEWAWEGALAGFALTFPLYLIRVTGAGDVKLFAMSGAFLGWHGVLYAILFSMIAAGLFALGYGAARGVLKRLLSNSGRLVRDLAIASAGGMRPTLGLAPGESVGKLAFGVSIAAGTVASVYAAQFGLV